MLLPHLNGAVRCKVGNEEVDELQNHVGVPAAAVWVGWGGVGWGGRARSHASTQAHKSRHQRSVGQAKKQKQNRHLHMVHIVSCVFVRVVPGTNENEGDEAVGEEDRQQANGAVHLLLQRASG